MPRVAEIVARTLKEYGVKYFFQVTGGDPWLWFALEDAGIPMVLCRSEAGAVYMADGHARSSGAASFVYGQRGPGAANLAGALADAYWAHSPVISLTSSTPLFARNRYDYQDIDEVALHAPVTRWAGEATQAQDVAHLLRHAIRHATAPPSGPTHLAIPRDLIEAESPDEEIYRESPFGTVPSVAAGPDPEAIPAVVDAVLAAERPVLIAGAGVVLSSATDELRAVAEALSLPVVTSMGGKGAIREDHDLALGVVGRYSRKAANDLVLECDLALVVGCRLGSLVTDSYRIPSRSTRVIHLDVDPGVLGTTYREAMSIVADPRLALRAIAEDVDRRGLKRERTPWARDAAKRIAGWRNELATTAARGADGAIHPATVISALTDALAPTDAVVADTGYMAAWVGATYPARAEGRYVLRAAGSLGWAFPAALGAALARPSARTVCVIGDGGIGYHVAELETAVRHQIPVVVIVLNNRSLAFEYHVQKFLFGRVVPTANDLTDVDYAAVARGFGAMAFRIDDPGMFSDALRESLIADCPVLLDVIVDKEAYAPVTYFEHVVARTL